MAFVSEVLQAREEGSPPPKAPKMRLNSSTGVIDLTGFGDKLKKGGEIDLTKKKPIDLDADDDRRFRQKLNKKLYDPEPEIVETEEQKRKSRRKGTRKPRPSAWQRNSGENV